MITHISRSLELENFSLKISLESATSGVCLDHFFTDLALLGTQALSSTSLLNRNDPELSQMWRMLQTSAVTKLNTTVTNMIWPTVYSSTDICDNTCLIPLALDKPLVTRRPGRQFQPLLYAIVHGYVFLHKTAEKKQSNDLTVQREPGFQLPTPQKKLSVRVEYDVCTHHRHGGPPHQLLNNRLWTQESKSRKKFESLLFTLQTWGSVDFARAGKP